MTTLVLDSGPFIAIDRSDRDVVAMLAAARGAEIGLRTSANVVAQVWRDPHGRQARLAALLKAVDICDVDADTGRAAGVLLTESGTVDAVDATVALLVAPGDQLLTSDPDDLGRLLEARGVRATVVAC